MRQRHIRCERSRYDRGKAIEEVLFWVSHLPGLLMVLVLMALFLAFVLAVTAS